MSQNEHSLAQAMFEHAATQPQASSPVKQKPQWRSLADMAATPDSDYAASRHREFPEGASELDVDGVSRRTFMKLMGAATALAGTATLTGCIRKPADTILPADRRPEYLIPGRPNFFATVSSVSGGVVGLLVESQDGRPTKIEGNPNHPASLGATDTRTQAAVLDLYDPARSVAILDKDTARDVASRDDALKAVAGKLAATQGQGFAVLTEYKPSPTYYGLLEKLATQYPQAKFYLDDAAYPRNQAEGYALVGAKGLRPAYAFDKAKVIFAADADFLGHDTDGSVVYTRQFADGRRLKTSADGMNRLYAVEPTFSVTGATADHRLRITGAQVFDFLAALATELGKLGVALPAGTESLLPALQKRSGEAFGKFLPALAKDLASSKGASLVVVGARQPAAAHALGLAINGALGNIGTTVTFQADPGYALPNGTTFGSLAQLAQDISGGKVSTLAMIGGNPAYTAPADLNFAQLIKSVATSIHLSYYKSDVCEATWHLPRSHFLESWGDLLAYDGTPAIQQPLIAPIFDTTLSEIELLTRLLSGSESAYEAVRGYWKKTSGLNGEFERDWRRWLHDGVVTVAKAAPATFTFDAAQAGGVFNSMPTATAPSAQALELNLYYDTKIFDGRFVNNAWLQELPDPMTKLTWDNAALVSPATARELGINFPSGSEHMWFDLVTVTAGGKSIEIACMPAPGIADNTVVIPLGWGQEFAAPLNTNKTENAHKNADPIQPRDAIIAGSNAFTLLTSGGFFTAGASLAKTGKTYKLASTQDHTYLSPELVRDRPIVRVASLSEYKEHPDFAKEPEKHLSLFSLWKERDPAEMPEKPQHQWGMTIDLNACTACGACSIACQAENNIPVVGKEQIARGREMHWIRLDRYYVGDENNPEAVVQPMACVHCENAPCEQVCPVAATVHSPEGTNDIAYNRCIGTRYCANNCPYKVRRFNFFNYNLEATAIEKMQKNPDVTVRFRGVVEKCSYCIQRVQEARHAAKLNGGDGKVKDGTIQTACQQACPAEAIAFGDISDPNSVVSKNKALERDYAVLAELNNKPRTTYLARVRNTNPELS
jgi:MoCo/4Fe-4S cofactor protein with predicted Tat translocation signal